MKALTTAGYPIHFNQSCYAYLHDILLLENYSKLFILADTNTAQYCLPGFMAQVVTELPIEIIEIEPGESNKAIETCIEVWHALTELGADRKSIMINLGGGVVTDLGGFVASTFKRGMAFINVPTSLLAMVDASIGGKTGVDLGVLKNQVGVISNPAAVLVDTQFLETLPNEEMRSGFAEMLKHGLIADSTYWSQFLYLENLTTDDIGLIIYRSIEIKTNITEQDPTEKGLRKILNFGHTLGHAIESYFLGQPEKKSLLHGEAVAIGMILESHISLEKKLVTPAEYTEIKEVVNSVFEKQNFTQEDVAGIMQLLVHDKKNEAGKVQFVLLERIGKAVIDQHVEKQLIINAFEDYQN